MITQSELDILGDMKNEPLHARHEGKVLHPVDLSDLNLPPLAAALISVVMVVLLTWLITWLQSVAHAHRPFTLFYFIPVAFCAAFLGVRGGLWTSLFALLAARLCLLHGLHSIFTVPRLADCIELFALAFGTVTVAIVTGRLRSVLGQLNEANLNLRESEGRRQSFNREVLLAVTGGRLMLCDQRELHGMVHGEAVFKMALHEPYDASKLRHAIKELVSDLKISRARLDDICTAATEAATNAVKHGGGGDAYVWVEPKNISVLVEDEGGGISPAQLARATLERGFSTRVSLGMGYYMMLEAVDNLALSTSPEGTSILLTVGNEERRSAEQNLLAQYGAL